MQGFAKGRAEAHGFTSVGNPTQSEDLHAAKILCSLQRPKKENVDNASGSATGLQRSVTKCKKSSTVIHILQANMYRNTAAHNLMDRWRKKEKQTCCCSVISTEIGVHQCGMPIYLGLLPPG